MKRARPGRPCSNPSCLNIQPCPVHANGPFARASRSNESMYRDPRWQRRKRLHRLQEPFCRPCREAGRLVPVHTVDHVTPPRGDPAAFFGGPLQSLCKRCSDAKTAREIAERKQR